MLKSGKNIKLDLVSLKNNETKITNKQGHFLVEFDGNCLKIVYGDY